MIASESLVDQLVAEPENFYASVHNPEYPEGAVREQLRAASPSAGTARRFLPDQTRSLKA